MIGRVGIAFDDGPLVASPTWTVIDQAGSFPDQFVSGYDVDIGRQTLLSTTDTGEATVYINDHSAGLFDPRNVSSPYHGKLDGKQILLQMYDPYRAVWEERFRGWIDQILYDVDGNGIDQNGDPINVALQIECVDVFAKLNEYTLTPGLDGVFPLGTPGGAPTGGEDGVWYAETAGSVDDRIIEILTDVGIDPTRYVVASGNVHAAEVKYDPGESALQALRDAADAELPFIGQILSDRHGKFWFHGRYSRFDPDGVSAEPGSQWDFHRWNVGDGKAIEGDSTRAQMRILSFTRGPRDIINWAVAYPKGLMPADMPGQVYADATSVSTYGQKGAPAMSDLLCAGGTVTGNNAKDECFLYAKLLVKNQKDPREAVSALQLKSVNPSDPRASATWPMLSQVDLSDIVNVKVGYPGGTGFAGGSPDDDYYVENMQLRVRPLQQGNFDYVELNLGVSPAVWSMDTHGVFPPFSS